MPKKGKGKNRKADKYYQLAREQGYRARSAFKLVQLNQKYDFLGSAKALIDLCAAPGGWCQVARKYMPVSSVIVGVDLVPIRPIPNVICLQEDITTPQCRAALKKALNTWKADVVLHDGSPNMGQAWLQDAYTQSFLVLQALKLATEFLYPGGTFVSKVFRSGDYNALMWVFNQLFKKVEATKPKSSRNASAEIFVVCQGYLAPASIDPRLLDPKHVFKELDLQPATTDVLAKKQPRRNRSGYEDGNMTLFKKTSVYDFIVAEEPVPFLGQYNQFVFDEKAKELGAHKATTPEIKACVEDLKVLGRQDFKRLLKWRLEMRNALHLKKVHQQEEAEKAEEEAPVQDPETLAVQEKLELEKAIDDRMSELEKKEKKKKKKQREKRQKHQRRIELGIHLPNDMIDQVDDDELFALSRLKEKTDIDVITETADVPTIIEKEVEEEDPVDDRPIEREEYDEILESYLDDMYDRYLAKSERQGKKLATVKKKKKELPTDEDDLSMQIRAPTEEEFEEEIRTDNPLMVKPDPKPTSKEAALWFSQKVFEGLDEEDGDDHDEGDEDEDLVDGDIEEEAEEDDEDEVPSPKKKQKTLTEEDEDEIDKAPSQDKKALVLSVAAKYDKEQLFAPDESFKLKEQQKENEAAEGNEDDKHADLDDSVAKRKRKREEQAEQHFDEVEAQRDFSDDEEDDDESSTDTDEMEESDIDEKAKTLALGKKLIMSKKRKRDLIDDAYNRWAFPDEDLPRWFADEEHRHSGPIAPLTRAEIEEMKAKFVAIDARPLKKVAEAKARKKRRAMRKMEKTKKKAAAIANSAELSERDKIKTIQRLYKDVGAQKKPNTVYVVSKAGGRAGAPPKGKRGKVKLVDPRMKKDKRGAARKEAKKAGKKIKPQRTRRKRRKR